MLVYFFHNNCTIPYIMRLLVNICQKSMNNMTNTHGAMKSEE